MVKRNMKSKRLKFSTDYASSMKEAKVCFITVDTPYLETGEADLRFVRNVATSIAKHMSSYCIIVNKSTVPVGTANFNEKLSQKPFKNVGLLSILMSFPILNF